MKTSVRHPAVASMFYPGNPLELKHQIQDFLGQVSMTVAQRTKVLIAPHAGYIYSGPIAASGYKMLEPLRQSIKKVILLGPAHRVYLQGLAAPSVHYFETPLGKILLDREVLDHLLIEFPYVVTMDQAHNQEHSLEVHLPFLQMLLADFTLVPLVVGDCSPEKVAMVLNRLWGDSETLIVVSTDLSHFESYTKAQNLDLQTAETIEAFDYEKLSPHGACGCFPVRGVLACARERHMQIKRMDLRNSGDTAGDKSRVVGYGSWILSESDQKGR
ncbi:MAG: AmmeMemoRadiSam system protein B [SAR324 cluster bacterium]|nr:AmmeMemoRadiSam system protein B [SAR324 cluster bacterium]